jgi:hypothetical protein
MSVLGLVGRRPVLREKNDVGSAWRRSITCKADVHARKATRTKHTRMLKTKECEACMQEDLAMIGLGFW